LPNPEESVHFCPFPGIDEARKLPRIENSVANMQSVIESGRVIRERSNRPIKYPISKMIVVHTDEEFLQDLNGPLQKYVVDELNIRCLETCSDPLKYAVLKAEPIFSLLGKRLGKSMGTISSHIKSLESQQVSQFQKEGRLQILDHEIKLNEVSLRYEFLHTEELGMDVDAATGDNGVMVIMELQIDDSLLYAGLAREIVSKIQKLRKSGGLQSSDEVSVHYEVLKSADDGKASKFSDIFVREREYFERSLSCIPQAFSTKTNSLVVIISEAVELSSGEIINFMLTKPSLTLNKGSLLEVCKGNVELHEGLLAVLKSMKFSTVERHMEDGKTLCIDLDGIKFRLLNGHHFSV